MGCKKRAQKAKIVERWQNWTSLKRNASALPGREWRRRWWSWWCRRRASRRPGPCRSCRASSWCCCAAGGSWRCGRRGGSSPQYSCFRQLFFHFRSRLRRTDRSQPFWTSFVPWKLGFQSRAALIIHVTRDYRLVLVKGSKDSIFKLPVADWDWYFSFYSLILRK